jgi:LuxR family maltose regulon positive regulatory protein
MQYRFKSKNNNAKYKYNRQMASMKMATFNSDQQALLSKLDQKVLSSWVTLKSKAIELPNHFLARPELSNKLSQGKAITWVLAPAGYGKSVLLSDWYGRHVTPSDANQSSNQGANQGTLGLWLTLDSKDNHEAFLLRHLLEAANKVMMGVATDALAHWSTTMNQGSLDCEEVLLLFLTELADLDCSLVLVLDNVHEIKDPAAWQVIQYLMTQLPPNMRLLMASRYIPNALGRLRLDSRLEFIKQQDLAFNFQQVTAWLQQAGINDPQQALSLMQRMQGWPAGMGLWLFCRKSNAWPKDLGYEREQLADYLMGEVLSGLDHELKEFLIRIAPLTSFNEILCNEVLGIADSRRLIQQLVHHNLFIDSIDERLGWFTLHPLLAELLCQYSSEQEREKTHLAAFHSLKQQGFRVEALQHARLGKLTQEAALWIESEVDRIIADLDFGTVLAWCDFVGSDIIASSARLQLMQIWSLLLTYQYAAVGRLMNQLDTHQIEKNYPGQLLALRGFIARGEGDYAQARSLCDLALRELPEDRFPIRVLMCSTLCNIELVNQKPEYARPWNRLAIDIARQHQALGLEVVALFDYARVEQYRGHLLRSAEIVDQGLELTLRLPQQARLFPHARLIIYRAFLRWLKGDIEGARQDAYIGINEASRCRDVIVLYAYSLLALIHIMNHEGKAALDTIAEAERSMQRWQVSERVYQNWISIVKANIWMALEKWDRSQECLDRVAKENDPLGANHAELFPMQAGLYCLSSARLLFQRKEYSNAIRLLESGPLKDQTGIIQLSATLLKAAVYASKNETSKAREFWHQGLQFAEQEKIQLDLNQLMSTSMVDLESTIGSILEVTEVSKTDNNPDGKHETVAQPSASAFIESSNLSIREQEVLALIAQGYSNQGIADQLFISLHTVKTHARKINAKLGAKSRTQAIVKARERMII